jgi:hypothetical protein
MLHYVYSCNHCKTVDDSMHDHVHVATVARPCDDCRSKVIHPAARPLPETPPPQKPEEPQQPFEATESAEKNMTPSDWIFINHAEEYGLMESPWAVLWLVDFLERLAKRGADLRILKPKNVRPEKQCHGCHEDGPSFIQKDGNYYCADCCDYRIGMHDPRKAEESKPRKDRS